MISIGKAKEFKDLNIEEKKEYNAFNASFIFTNLPELAKQNSQVGKLFINNKLNEKLKTYSYDDDHIMFLLLAFLQKYVNDNIVDQDYFNVWWEQAQWVHVQTQIERVLNRGYGIHE